MQFCYNISVTAERDNIKSVEFIEQLIKPTQGKEGVPCILQFSDIERGENEKIKGLKVEIAHIPFHMVEIVKTIKKQIQEG